MARKPKHDNISVTYMYIFSVLGWTEPVEIAAILCRIGTREKFKLMQNHEAI